MRPMKERVNLTLDGDLLEDLRVYAENDDRSLSQYVNHILKDHMVWLGLENKTRENIIQYLSLIFSIDFSNTISTQQEK